MFKENDCWDACAHDAVSKYASRLLWRFIQHNARESTADEIITNITGLTKRDVKMLADIRFLLSDEVKQLLNETAPKIISRLTKASITEKVIERSNIKGRIDWPRTYGIRAASGGDASLYVYAKRAQMFDLPENRLFLHVIQQIHNCARNISTDDFSSLIWDSETLKGDKWINRINMIAAQTARFLRNPYIARIGKLNELSEKIIEQTKHARAPYYRDLAGTAESYSFCQNNPVIFLNEVLKGNILEPLNRDTLYEIAVLFKIIETAIKCGWKETRLGLIGNGSKTVCTLKSVNCTLRVFYQKLPEVFAKNSKYGILMSKYGLSEKLRRPDIILSFEDGVNETYCIIEVKRSARRSYLVDGTYKLLGYLKDFEGICDENITLKGFLVGWKGITPIQYDPHKQVHLFSWDNLEDGLLDLVKSR